MEKTNLELKSALGMWATVERKLDEMATSSCQMIASAIERRLEPSNFVDSA
jgi:hypothetical protein